MWAATAASALPIFTATPTGDWFDGASWSGGIAPTAADAPVIDNGAIATASSASPSYPGSGADVEAASLSVGSRLDPAQPATASGGLQATDVDVAMPAARSARSRARSTA
jgi:hypothetical protein